MAASGFSKEEAKHFDQYLDERKTELDEEERQGIESHKAAIEESESDEDEEDYEDEDQDLDSNKVSMKGRVKYIEMPYPKPI